MIKLSSVYKEDTAHKVLYDLLAERTPEQSISHKGMPEWSKHVEFIESRPYHAWFLIRNDEDDIVGSIYLSRAREIGVAIFRDHQRKGYGKAAVQEIMRKYPGKFLANVNPRNMASIRMFENLGFLHAQNTYTLC